MSKIDENNVSVVIHTFNEEKNIRNCLESVKWADEIIIVDMHSDDKTVEISREYTDKIYLFENVGYADPARKFSLEKTTNKWVLSVDADEMIPLKLKNRLLRIMAEDKADVVYVPHNNYFAGTLIIGSGWGALQNLHPRFFNKDFFDFSDEIHNFSQVKENARIYKIEDPQEGFIHFSYTDVEHFIKKINRYTTIEARNLYEKNENIKRRTLIIDHMIREPLRRYITLKGYKDGFIGVYIAVLMIIYNLLVYMKLKLMKHYKTRNPRKKIEEDYQKIVDTVISEYKK